MKQNKLYSRLTSLLVMVMLALVGQTAMAQDATFDLRNVSENPLTDNGVAVTYAPYGTGGNIWGDHNLSFALKVTAPTGKKIGKIEFDAVLGYDYGGSVVENTGQGTSFEYNRGGTSIWQGNSSEVTFVGTSGDTDIYVTLVRVWFATGGEEPPVGEFPKTGVPYSFKESTSNLYLNLINNSADRKKDVILGADAEPLYFTAVTGGFTISNAAGLYVGKYTGNTWNMSSETAEVWTVEAVGTGYALKSPQGYLGFDSYASGSAAFRDKGQSARAIFNIEEIDMSDKTYTVNVTGNPSDVTVTVKGVDVVGGSVTVAGPATQADVVATDIAGYEYTVSISGDVITVTYSKLPSYVEFVTTGISSGFLEKDGVSVNGSVYGGYLNLYYYGWTITISHPTRKIVKVVFESTNGFQASASTGSVDNTTKTWTGSANEIVFSTNGDYNISNIKVYLEDLTPQEKGTFGLATTQETDITGEEISRYPNFNLAEDYTMALGLTDQQVYIQDAMKFYKVVEGVDVEISSPIGDICVYPSSSGQSTIWLNGSQNCETPGVYKFVFPKGLFENAANENEEFTITYTIEKQLHYYNSNAVQENDFVLNGFDVVFNHDVTSVDVTDAALYCGTEEVSTTIGYSIEGATVHFTFTPAIVTAGSYKLSIPAGAVVSDGVATTEVVETYPATVKNRLVVTSAGWTTFCPSENVKLPSGYTPYILTKAEDGQATIQEILGSYPTTTEYFWLYSNGSVVENDGVLISKAYGSSEAVGIKLDANATFTDGDCLKLLANGQVTVSSDYTIKSIFISGYGNCTVNGVAYTPNTYADLNAKSFTITTEGGETMTIDYLYVSYEDQTQGRNDVVIPAGEGILVQGAENAAVAYESTWETPSDVTGNLLYGCTADEEYTDYADCYFYKFSLNKNNEAGSEGFYWGSADGHSISMHAGKAYLILDADDTAGIRGFRLFGEETEGISMKTTDNGQQPVFNLQGQRMGGKLSTGIYVKNGKKVLVK